MVIDRHRIHQLFKYSVYALLTINIYVFFSEEWAASAYRFSDGIAPGEIIEGFAASIDTAAWVVLLLMFELETYALDDKYFTRRVTLTLHSLRAICYAFIVYSFYGYLIKLLFIYSAVPFAGPNDLCAIVDGAWAYAVDLDEYEILTASNCAAFSQAGDFMRLQDMAAVVDQHGFIDIVRLAWVDVINSAVWLLVVIVLEIDVRLQERNKLIDTALWFSTLSKYILYSALFLAAVYWGFKGDFVDFWDAFLWLVAFVFIELNVVEWRQESAEQSDLPTGSTR